MFIFMFMFEFMFMFMFKFMFLLSTCWWIRSPTSWVLVHVCVCVHVRIRVHFMFMPKSLSMSLSMSISLHVVIDTSKLDLAVSSTPLSHDSAQCLWWSRPRGRCLMTTKQSSDISWRIFLYISYRLSKLEKQGGKTRAEVNNWSAVHPFFRVAYVQSVFYTRDYCTVYVCSRYEHMYMYVVVPHYV